MRDGIHAPTESTRKLCVAGVRGDRDEANPVGANRIARSG